MWSVINAGKLGVRFSRQMPVGPYICDFLSRSALLAIELDGDTHATAVAYDTRRDAFIRSRGIRILRFSNREVMGNLEGVVDAIQRIGGWPHPRPLPQAGGEVEGKILHFSPEPDIGVIKRA